MVRMDYLESVLGATDSVGDIPTLDLLAFSLVVFLAKRSRAARVDIWTILDKIAEDSTWYFVVIFTSQLVLALTLGFARVSATGSLSLLQKMTSRCVSLQPTIQLLPVP